MRTLDHPTVALRRFTIHNPTHWRTDDIKKILRACILHEGLDPNDSWRVKLYYTRRCNGVMGYAYYDSREFKIGLPRRIKVTDVEKGAGGWNYSYKDDNGKVWHSYARTGAGIPGKGFDPRKIDKYTKRWTDPDELPLSVRKRIFKVAIHEIGHCKGLRHPDMVCSYGSAIDLDWADMGDYPVRKKSSAKPKPKTDRGDKAIADVERIEAEIAKIEKRHKARMKGWKTRLAKAKRSANYYRNKQAAEPKEN